MRMTIVSGLAALLLVANAIPAAAETVSIEVPYGDLDLASSTGMATLESRVKVAIKRVCGTPQPDLRDLNDRLDYWRCIKKARAAAAAEIARATGHRAVLARSGNAPHQ